MEDLWKVAKIDYRIDAVADRAQYDRMIRRFHEEEVRYHSDHLLYGDDHLTRENPPHPTDPPRHRR